MKKEHFKKKHEVKKASLVEKRAQLPHFTAPGLCNNGPLFDKN